MHHLLILGFGYSAEAVARLALAAGWQVSGTTRNPARADQMQAMGVTPVLLPDGVMAAASGASHILASAAPDAAGDPFLQHYPQLADLAPMWTGYLSTTGVYGDHGGAWVDEETPLTPSTTRGAWRVAAEAQWQATGLGVHIFRLAGIYGPTRGPFSKVKDGSARRIIKQGQVFSRIHVDDIAAVVMASMQAPVAGGRIYNICDDDPAPPEDVLSYAAHLLGLPEPPAVDFATADMTPMARSFYAESKRVSNARIKAELGVRLIHPDYRHGLESLLAAESQA